MCLASQHGGRVGDESTVRVLLDLRALPARAGTRPPALSHCGPLTPRAGVAAPPCAAHCAHPTPVAAPVLSTLGASGRWRLPRVSLDPAAASHGRTASPCTAIAFGAERFALLRRSPSGCGLPIAYLSCRSSPARCPHAPQTASSTGASAGTLAKQQRQRSAEARSGCVRLTAGRYSPTWYDESAVPTGKLDYAELRTGFMNAVTPLRPVGAAVPHSTYLTCAHVGRSTLCRAPPLTAVLCHFAA